MSNGKILGMDIGVASVGVGIIDVSTGEVIHASSRIFSSANAANNAERRGFRGSLVLANLAGITARVFIPLTSFSDSLCSVWPKISAFSAVIFWLEAKNNPL